MKPKLVIDCRMVSHSGIGTYIQNIVPLLAAQSTFSMHLLGDEALLQQYFGQACPAAATKHIRAGIYSIKEQLELPLSVPRKTDLVWIPHYAAPLLCPAPIVATVHDICHIANPELFPGIHKRLYAHAMMRALRHRARRIIAVSQFTKSELVQRLGFPAKNIHVVPNGVHAWWFERSEQPSPYPKPYFIAVGNVKPHKNIARLIRAFGGVCGQIEHDLILVGDYNDIRSPVDAMGIARLAGAQGRVKLLGKISNKSLKLWLKHATGLVYPSLYEGFGLPPLEAMACGCPVLASNIPPVQEVCGNIASYFDPYSEENISRELLKASQAKISQTKKDKMLECAKKFNWESSAMETLKILIAALRSP